jgi:hypothetical protein
MSKEKPITPCFSASYAAANDDTARPADVDSADVENAFLALPRPVETPATPLDKAKLIFALWQFTVAPATGDAATSCVVDITVDDVRFY